MLYVACCADNKWADKLLTDDGDVTIPPEYADLLTYGAQPITTSMAAVLAKHKGKGKARSPAAAAAGEAEDAQ